MSSSTRLSNKELGRVVKVATRNGWEHVRTSRGGHTFLQRDGHRIPIASSPSDGNAHRAVARKVRRCEEGTCEHVRRG